jgi:hypothetical protein
MSRGRCGCFRCCCSRRSQYYRHGHVGNENSYSHKALSDLKMAKETEWLSEKAFTLRLARRKTHCSRNRIENQCILEIKLRSVFDLHKFIY